MPRNCLCESIRADLAWVAIDTTGTPIGFSVAQAFGSTLHLLEVSVEPAHTRLGIGRSLVSTVIDKACAANFSIMTLTTFAHIPWNAPFYLSCGFRQISPTELSTRLADSIQQEERLGLSNRVAMMMRLDTRNTSRNENNVLD